MQHNDTLRQPIFNVRLPPHDLHFMPDFIFFELLKYILINLSIFINIIYFKL
jgi:hypothetical protein